MKTKLLILVVILLSSCKQQSQGLIKPIELTEHKGHLYVNFSETTHSFTHDADCNKKDMISVLDSLNSSK